MGNSYLTFNYTAAECCEEVGHIVHQSERALEVWKRERINWGKLGHKEEASVNGLICGPQLTPATPCDVSVSHARIHHLLYLHTFADAGIHISRQSTHTLKDKCPKRHADSSLWTPAGGPCRALLNSHDTSNEPLGISSPVPSFSSSSHSPPSPFLLCFLPVSETDVRSKLDMQQCTHSRLLKISKCTEDAGTMKHVHMLSVICQPAAAKTVNCIF